MKTSAMLPIAGLVLACALPAQVLKIIPRAATQAGSTSSPYFSGYGGGRMQQIVEGGALCRVNAILREVRLRADGKTAIPARSFQRVKLSAGYSANAASSIAANFASNRKGAQSVVFDKAYSLPAQGTTRPFNIIFKFNAPFTFVRANGNLLLEWEVPQAPTKANYFFDAHAMLGGGGSGTTSVFGTGGRFASADAYSVSSDASTLYPGGSAPLEARGLSRGYLAVSFWGFSDRSFGSLPLPLDLTGLQAPGNWLNVSIDLSFPIVMQGSGTNYGGRAVLPIPRVDALVGLDLFGQILFLDSRANARGWVLSRGVKMTIGLPLSVVTKYVGHYDHTQANGFLNRTAIGHVLQFSGVYN